MNKQNLPQDIINRFWSKVIKLNTGNCCWEWTAGLTSNGYGQFFYNNIHINAHRFAWEYFYGTIPNDKIICHHCDNRKCCNPSHLFLGTNKDNTQDMINKNKLKGGWAPGSEHANTNLTEEDVIQIKQMLQNGIYQKDIADHFGITQTSVSRIKLGKTWSHVK